MALLTSYRSLINWIKLHFVSLREKTLLCGTGNFKLLIMFRNPRNLESHVGMSHCGEIKKKGTWSGEKKAAFSYFTVFLFDAWMD